MRVRTIDRDRDGFAQLRPTQPAMRTVGTAMIMVDHHPRADLVVSADGYRNVVAHVKAPDPNIIVRHSTSERTMTPAMTARNLRLTAPRN